MDLQSLVISIVSYMESLTVSAVIEKEFLDPQKFKSCVENAFEIILKAADEIPNQTKISVFNNI